MTAAGIATILAAIDDYENTAFAMLGLANLYRFDDLARSFREHVQFYQGRRLTTSAANRRSPSTDVTPDLAIVVNHDSASLAEVKMSLPGDRSLWVKTIEQLERYDDDLIGWPGPGGRVGAHDVMLVVHQMRIAIVDVIKSKLDAGDLKFERPFVVLSFIRSDQRDMFFLFRLEFGEPTFAPVRQKLASPVSIPGDVIAVYYGRFKLWDSRPPIPYVMDLIWREVVADRAASDDRFPSLRRNSRLPVELSVSEIATYLQENFSFDQSLAGDASDAERQRQPSVPRVDWVRAAISAFVDSGQGRWLDEQRTRCVIDYQKQNLNVEEFAARYLSTGAGIQEYGGQIGMFAEVGPPPKTPPVEAQGAGPKEKGLRNAK